MSRIAILCPGRGSYTEKSLGSLPRESERVAAEPSIEVVRRKPTPRPETKKPYRSPVAAKPRDTQVAYDERAGEAKSESLTAAGGVGTQAALGRALQVLENGWSERCQGHDGSSREAEESWPRAHRARRSSA